MSENVNIPENGNMLDGVEIVRRCAAARIGLFLLAFSLALPLMRYLWQVYSS